MSVNNGKVVNWSGTDKGGVYAGGRNARMQHLQVVANDNGFVVTGSGAVISDCTISGNGNHGVYLNGTSGTCEGNTIANCTISGNAGTGVNLDGTSGMCDGNTIANCTISGNTDTGVVLWSLGGQGQGQCNGNTVANCTISGNMFGINIVADGNAVTGCTIRKNIDYGILIQFSDANRVEGNHISGQTGNPSYGIYCTGAKNLIIRNLCEGQTANFVMSISDTYGPIVTSSGVLPTTGAGAHPWANFSR